MLWIKRGAPGGPCWLFPLRLSSSAGTELQGEDRTTRGRANALPRDLSAGAPRPALPVGVRARGPGRQSPLAVVEFPSSFCKGGVSYQTFLRGMCTSHGGPPSSGPVIFWPGPVAALGPRLICPVLFSKRGTPVARTREMEAGTDPEGLSLEEPPAGQGVGVGMGGPRQEPHSPGGGASSAQMSLSSTSAGPGGVTSGGAHVAWSPGEAGRVRRESQGAGGGRSGWGPGKVKSCVLEAGASAAGTDA